MTLEQLLGFVGFLDEAVSNAAMKPVPTSDVEATAVANGKLRDNVSRLESEFSRAHRVCENLNTQLTEARAANDRLGKMLEEEKKSHAYFEQVACEQKDRVEALSNQLAVADALSSRPDATVSKASNDIQKLRTALESAENAEVYWRKRCQLSEARVAELDASERGLIQVGGR